MVLPRVKGFPCNLGVDYHMDAFVSQKFIFYLLVFLTSDIKAFSLANENIFLFLFVFLFQVFLWQFFLSTSAIRSIVIMKI